MKPPDREMSKAEYDAWKTGNRQVRANILRGHQKIRINAALDKKIRLRMKKAKKRAAKARKKERMMMESLRQKQSTPMIAVAP